MKPNYKIIIHDIHTIDEEISDTTSTVFGDMEFADDGYVIRYFEPAGDLEGMMTELRVTGPDSVLISRQGDVSMDLMLERARRHNCLYNIPEGNLMMGVFANSIDSHMGPRGGTLDLDYNIDFNAGFISENQLQITVKPIF